MTRSSISTKYQVVIPKEIREQFRLKPGQKVSFIAKGRIVYLIPERPLKEMRGILKLPPDWMKRLREKMPVDQRKQSC